VGYILDMFGVKQNDGINCFISSWKILIFFLNNEKHASLCTSIYILVTWLSLRI